MHTTATSGPAGHQNLHTPVTRQVLLAGFVLTLLAGGVNAVGFLGVQHQALTHLTGTITQLSLRLSEHAWPQTLDALGIIGAFFFGCLLSGLITRQSSLKIGRRYGVALMLESALLCGGALMLRRGHTSGDLLASLACGLQNGLATSWAGAVIRTTHMTGIVTDLGLACAHWLRGMRGELPKLRLHAVLLMGFISGGVLGTWGFALWSYDTLFIPAAITGLSGLTYFVWKQTQRRSSRSA